MIDFISDQNSTANNTCLHIESTVEVQVGARLKIVREQNGLSQRELAKRSGVTHSSISMIEQGLNSPSVNSLEKILNGIPMTLAQFFICDPLSAVQVVYRANELAKQQKQDAVITVQPIPHKSPKLAVAFQKFILAVETDTGAIPRQSSHAISGMVMAGLLELTANMHVSILQVGDAFSLSAQQPYRLRNLSPTDECVLIVCEA